MSTFNKTEKETTYKRSRQVSAPKNNHAGGCMVTKYGSVGCFKQRSEKPGFLNLAVLGVLLSFGLYYVP